MTKQSDEFLAPNLLRDRSVGFSAMKNFLDIDETPLALEQSFKAATKLKRVLSTNTEMKTVLLIER